mgnify:CR=1 FL=1
MFAIVTDTAANLESSWLQSHQVKTIPFVYSVDGVEKSCANLADFDPRTYYEAIRNGSRVKTSQITPQQYLDCMEPLLDAGQDVLFVGMSSGISGSFASAQMAVKMMRCPERQIRLVDTLGASLGEGLLVMEAARLREEGRSLDETACALEGMRQSMCQVFTVEDLMHLRLTGRLSSVKALVGTVLKIKPLLKGDATGRIVNFANVRGRKQAIMAMAKRYDELVARPEEQTVGIAHADCPEDAQMLETLLRANHPPREILTVPYEPMTGSHVGPGALALFFLGEENARSKLV